MGAPISLIRKSVNNVCARALSLPISRLLVAGSLIIPWGYCIWGLLLACIPLFVIGMVMMLVLLGGAWFLTLLAGGTCRSHVSF